LLVPASTLLPDTTLFRSWAGSLPTRARQRLHAARTPSAGPPSVLLLGDVDDLDAIAVTAGRDLLDNSRGSLRGPGFGDLHPCLAAVRGDGHAVLGLSGHRVDALLQRVRVDPRGIVRGQSQRLLGITVGVIGVLERENDARHGFGVPASRTGDLLPRVRIRLATVERRRSRRRGSRRRRTALGFNLSQVGGDVGGL